MPTVTYDLITKSNGTLTARYNTASPNNWTIGQTASFTFEIQESDFSIFEDYARHAGNYSTLDTLANDQKYTEQFESPVVDSLLWGVRPSQDLQDKDVVGVWGLVDSITNERPQSLSTNRYSVDVFVLAPYSQYMDHAAVESDLLI